MRAECIKKLISLEILEYLVLVLTETIINGNKTGKLGQIRKDFKFYRGVRHFKNLVHFLKKHSTNPKKIWHNFPRNPKNFNDLDSRESSRNLKNPQKSQIIPRNPWESQQILKNLKEFSTTSLGFSWVFLFYFQLNFFLERCLPKHYHRRRHDFRPRRGFLGAIRAPNWPTGAP